MADLPFTFDKPEDSPGFLLWQTTMTWQRLIRKSLDPYEISHPQFVIMATVLWFQSHQNETTQINIINWTKLDKMTVSKALKPLIAKGLVTRKEHSEDTRAKSVLITPKGQKLLNQLVAVVEGVDKTYFCNLQTQEQKTLIQLFNKLGKDDKQ